MIDLKIVWHILLWKRMAMKVWAIILINGYMIEGCFLFLLLLLYCWLLRFLCYWLRLLCICGWSMAIGIKGMTNNIRIILILHKNIKKYLSGSIIDIELIKLHIKKERYDKTY